eukprot:10245082-Heterocapsa_arctica.AAC.1
MRTWRFAILLLWWQALGPGLSWPKVSRGKRVEWCGADLTVLGGSQVRAGIIDKTAKELAEEIGDMLKLDVVVLSRVRRFAGR